MNKNKCEHEFAFIEKKRADWIPYKNIEVKIYRCIMCNKQKTEKVKGGV